MKFKNYLINRKNIHERLVKTDIWNVLEASNTLANELGVSEEAFVEIWVQTKADDG